jgi:hypothetical protein
MPKDGWMVPTREPKPGACVGVRFAVIFDAITVPIVGQFILLWMATDHTH